MCNYGISGQLLNSVNDSNAFPVTLSSCKADRYLDTYADNPYYMQTLIKLFYLQVREIG